MLLTWHSQSLITYIAYLTSFFVLFVLLCQMREPIDPYAGPVALTLWLPSMVVAGPLYAWFRTAFSAEFFMIAASQIILCWVRALYLFNWWPEALEELGSDRVAFGLRCAPVVFFACCIFLAMYAALLWLIRRDPREPLSKRMVGEFLRIVFCQTTVAIVAFLVFAAYPSRERATYAGVLIATEMAAVAWCAKFANLAAAETETDERDAPLS